MTICRIYTLIDPRTDEIRYVGKTTRTLGQRLKAHLYQKSTGYKCHWVQQLLDLGLKPICNLLEITDESHWQEREIYWIARLRAEGCELTNMTPGGDGIATGSHLSEETKIKMSQAHKGIRHTEEERKKISEAQKGRVFSKEEREKMGAPKIGRPLSEEHRKKLSIAGKGRKKTEEWKKKIGLANKGRHHTEESLAKMSRAHKGVVLTEETKRKMSESHKGKTFSKEHKAKLSAALKGEKNGQFGRHHSEETKKKIGEASKKS
jgi:hypothetical protein